MRFIPVHRTDRIDIFLRTSLLRITISGIRNQTVPIVLCLYFRNAHAMFCAELFTSSSANPKYSARLPGTVMEYFMNMFNAECEPYFLIGRMLCSDIDILPRLNRFFVSPKQTWSIHMLPHSVISQYPASSSLILPYSQSLTGTGIPCFAAIFRRAPENISTSEGRFAMPSWRMEGIPDGERVRISSM